MSLFLTMDIEDCRKQGHHFKLTWSDKTPLKANLLCDTCTAKNPGKTVYVAYGIAEQSFGQWRRRDDDRRDMLSRYSLERSEEVSADE